MVRSEAALARHAADRRVADDGVPLLLRRLAAEAVAGCSSLSTPEELAQAALAAIWPILPPRKRNGITPEERAVCTYLADLGYSRRRIGELTGRSINRIDNVLAGFFQRDADGNYLSRGGWRLFRAQPEPFDVDRIADIIRTAR